MQGNDPLSALRALQENASRFFDAAYARHATHMQCGVGCSQCCEVERTVLPSEAARIVDWWAALPPAQRAERVAQWTAALEDAASDAAPTCAFLHARVCTIYEARPIICRTQGMALRFRVEPEVDAHHDAARVETAGRVASDACPLNFTSPGSFPPAAEHLDLDRLNLFLSLAEKQYQSMRGDTELADRVDFSSGRISLAELRDALMESLRDSSDEVSARH